MQQCTAKIYNLNLGDKLIELAATQSEDGLHRFDWYTIYGLK
jgi:hypothetical protein